MIRASIALVFPIFVGAASAAAAISPTPSAGPEPAERLLVLPRSPADLASRYGLSDAAAEERHRRASGLLHPHLIAEIPAVDLKVIAVDHGGEAFAEALRATGDYAIVEPDLLVLPQGTSNDPLLSKQWQLAQIGALGAWDFHTGEKVICAFIDTGIDQEHPDLAGALVPGYNAVSKKAQGAGGLVEDINGHGTSVAGAPCAIGNNAIGGSGVGWNFPIMPVRASNQPSGAAFLSDIFDGVIWAVENGARVVSVSYAGVQSSSVESIGKWARGQGALLVWAADDTGSNYDSFDHPSVTIVGGTDKEDLLTATSSWGRAIDVVAPAVGIYVPKLAAMYQYRTGNSFAAPLAAGVLALILSADPMLSPAEAEGVLFASCADLGETGEDDVYGHGRIDARAAMGLLFQPVSIGKGTPFLPASEPGDLGEGLLASFYVLDDPKTLPNLAGMRRAALSLVDAVEFLPGSAPFAGTAFTREFGMLLEGWFIAPSSGHYEFTLQSADGSRLWLDDVLIVDHDGVHAFTPRTGGVGLAAGAHRIAIGFFCDEAEAGLTGSVSGPALPGQPLRAGMLRFTPDPADLNRDAKVDLFDFLEFQNAFVSGSPAADFDHNGVLDLFDFLEFLDAHSKAKY